MPPSAHLASVRILLLLAAMSALDAMAIDLYASAFPTMQRDFDVSPNAIQATMSVFLVGAGLGQIFFGPALDSCGRRPTILIGAGSFAVGSFICALAPSYEVFIAGRLIQSVGAASAMVAPRAIIADIYEPKAVARIFSIIMQIMMIAPIVSPPLGAFLLTHIGWRADFWLLAALGLCNFLAIFGLFPETLPLGRRHSLRGTQIGIAYLSTIRRPRFFLLMMSGGFVSGTLYAFLGASPFAFISGYGMNPVGYSLLVGAIAFAFVLVGGLNIRLLKRYSPTQLTLWGLAIQTAIALLLTILTFGGAPSLAVYIGLAGIAVAALGLSFPNITALAMADAGANAGLGSAAVGISQSLISASAGLMLGLTGTDRHGMMVSISSFALLALAAVLSARQWRPDPEAGPTLGPFMSSTGPGLEQEQRAIPPGPRSL